MPEYKNGSFYENLTEANRRLNNTVVMYGDEPVRIFQITEHNPDGILRVYCCPIHLEDKIRWPNEFFEANWPAFDKWMAEQPDFPVMRKHINSPQFNRFRPFPLGMMNLKKSTSYWERTPVRHSEQGLTRNMVVTHQVSLKEEARGGNVLSYNISGAEIRAGIRGEYPDFDYVLKNLRDPDEQRETAAFHREFALIRGPLDTIYLQYKTEVIGLVQNEKDILVGRKFRHYKEVVEECKAFTNVTVQI